jgi:hypothetical protein
VRPDGRDLEPSPAGFLAALGRALDEPPDTAPLEAMARRPRGVLLVDTYETLVVGSPGFATLEWGVIAVDQALHLSILAMLTVALTA